MNEPATSNGRWRPNIDIRGADRRLLCGFAPAQWTAKVGSNRQRRLLKNPLGIAQKLRAIVYEQKQPLTIAIKIQRGGAIVNGQPTIANSTKFDGLAMRNTLTTGKLGRAIKEHPSKCEPQTAASFSSATSGSTGGGGGVKSLGVAGPRPHQQCDKKCDSLGACEYPSYE